MLIFDQLKKNDPQLRVLTLVVLVGLAVLLTGVWWVQVISYRQYAENQKAQAFRTVRIPAIRGKITDRNGLALAENQPSYRVQLYLDELRPLFKSEWQRVRPKTKLTRQQRLNLEAATRYGVVSNIAYNVATALQQPVEMSPEKFAQHYVHQLSLPMELGVIRDEIQIARYYEQRSNPPGLDLDVQPLRHYPYRTLGAHILGSLVLDNSSVEGEDAFFNFRLPDYRGNVGIEGVYDNVLRGRAGMKSVLVNSLGYRQSENVWTPAEPGQNVVLTIDLGVQRAAENALRTFGSSTRGSVVVLDPRNGDILAMASSPAYDPNVYIPRISTEEYKKLLDKDLRPMINRSCQENYQPGSIFKIVTALACLEAGLDPNQLIYVPPNPNNPARGHIQLGRRIIKDTAGPGDYDFRRAFIKSSNSYFVTNGLRAGVERIVKLGQKLQFGVRTGLPTGQEVPGNFPTEKSIRRGWSDGDTANLCIGQGRIDVTPIQMAVMIAAIANGGTVLAPRLVDHIDPQEISPESRVSYPKRQVRAELGVSRRSLDIVRNAMLADVEDPEGTGRGAAVPGFRVCGKTGTAEVEDTRGNVVDWITWFASYAPFEQPKYVVVVMIESGRSGGGTCAPVARQVYQFLQRREIDLAAEKTLAQKK